MSALLTHPLGRKLTRLEVNRLLRDGAFAGRRFELIDGDLIDKMGQGPEHADAIEFFTEALRAAFAPRKIRVQLPIEAKGRDRQSTQPEPDLAVVATPGVRFTKRHPHGHELLLVVEIADTSRAMDLTRKRDLYAQAGVPEYWVFDVFGPILTVHRKLQNGQYTEVVNLSGDDRPPYLNCAIRQLLPVDNQ